LVEAAERWELVKPQAWFDSPAVIMPYTPIPSLQRKRQEGLGDGQMIDGEYVNEEGIEEPTENDSPVQLGSYITEGGLESTFEVTEAMLKEFNFEALEHVTVRVWIDHQRRGDVDVELISPNGITSVLARQRRFDNANTGYPGWKFMTLKHW
jgi:kexin